MKRLKIGDVLQFPLRGQGFGYAQYICNDVRSGKMIRVYDYLSQSPLTDLSPIPNAFLFRPVYVSLNAARHYGWEVIGNRPCADVPFPGFKRKCRDGWFIWEGGSTHKTTDQQGRFVSELPEGFEEAEDITGFPFIVIQDRVLSHFFRIEMIAASNIVDVLMGHVVNAKQASRLTSPLRRLTMEDLVTLGNEVAKGVFSLCEFQEREPLPVKE